MHKTPPFNTGKVKIGECYQHRQHYIPSRDMEHLQRAYLEEPHPRLEQALDVFLACVLAAFITAGLLAWFDVL